MSVSPGSIDGEVGGDVQDVRTTTFKVHEGVVSWQGKQGSM
jgi:hypothetical protein